MSHVLEGRAHRQVWGVLAIAVLCAGVCGPAAGSAQTTPATPPWVPTIAVDAGFGDYAGGGSASQSLALYLARPDRYWRFSAGHHRLIESEAYSAGFSYQHSWRRKYRLGAGFSSGVNRSGGLAPRYYLSLSAGMNVIGSLPTSISWGRRRSAINESYVDRYGLGFSWYAPGPWIISGNGAYSLGQPGSTSSRSFGGGITYSLWERMSIGARVDHGDGSYMLLPSQNIVDFQSWSYSGSFSKHLNPGTSVRVSVGYSEYYEGPNVNLGYSRRW
jgi:YaiO family outer membrane protein